MAPEPFTLSVVCPAYNEEQALPLFHGRLAAVLDALPDDCRAEAVYVDDGPHALLLPVQPAVAARDGRARCPSFSRNSGHQAALTAGLEAARGDAVVSLASDLQHPPELIPVLLGHWRQSKDVVI